jgi:hypothetical protein
LAALASGSVGSLAASCRAAGPGGEDQAIRDWYRDRYDIELDAEALAPIREYLRRPPTAGDPAMQPPLLFDPEVDG